jgi:hypothetical protein
MPRFNEAGHLGRRDCRVQWPYKLMMDAAIMVAIARGTPIRVIAVAASAAWRDGFIIFVPSYLRQDLAVIGGSASSVAHQANRMKRSEFAIAMMNLTLDSRYRAGTIFRAEIQAWQRA